jgi:hypothetical protein
VSQAEVWNKVKSSGSSVTYGSIHQHINMIASEQTKGRALIHKRIPNPLMDCVHEWKRKGEYYPVIFHQFTLAKVYPYSTIFF